MPIWSFRPKAKISAQTFFTNCSWESSLSSQILISISLHPYYVWCFDQRIKQRGFLSLSALLDHGPGAIAIHMPSSASSLSKCPLVHNNTQRYWKTPWDLHVLHNHLLIWSMHRRDLAASWCKRHFFLLVLHFSQSPEVSWPWHFSPPCVVPTIFSADHCLYASLIQHELNCCGSVPKWPFALT